MCAERTHIKTELVRLPAATGSPHGVLKPLLSRGYAGFAEEIMPCGQLTSAVLEAPPTRAERDSRDMAERSETAPSIRSWNLLSVRFPKLISSSIDAFMGNSGAIWRTLE